MHILFLTQTTALGASSRARIYQWLPFLDDARIHYTVRPGVPEFLDKIYLSRPVLWVKILWFCCKITSRVLILPRLKKYDLVVLQRETLPYFNPWLDKLILRLSKKAVFDFDDAIFYYFKQKSFIKRVLLNFNAVEKIIKQCDAVITSTPYLAEYAEQFHSQVFQIPTCIHPPEDLKSKSRHDGPVVIGWIGSPSTLMYLDEIVPVLLDLTKLYSIKLKLFGVTDCNLKDLNVECHTWKSETEWSDIQSFDIGIMPLPDNPWTRGKGGYKLLQYLSAGVPAVASPVGINTNIIEHGVNGYLAGNQQEWMNCLSTLITSTKISEKFRKQGFEIINKNYTFQANAKKWIELFMKTGSS